MDKIEGINLTQELQFAENVTRRQKKKSAFYDFWHC